MKPANNIDKNNNGAIICPIIPIELNICGNTMNISPVPSQINSLIGIEDVDDIYVNEVLPGKMKYNLESIRSFSLAAEVATMIRTVLAVLGKKY